MMHAVRVYTTPEELRAIADKMERMCSELSIGGSTTAHIFGAASNVAVHVCCGQDGPLV